MRLIRVFLIFVVLLLVPAFIAHASPAHGKAPPVVITLTECGTPYAMHTSACITPACPIQPQMGVDFGSAVVSSTASSKQDAAHNATACTLTSDPATIAAPRAWGSRNRDSVAGCTGSSFAPNPNLGNGDDARDLT